jgi:DNA (cytosine-5)-methyltransferase 1
LVIDTAQVTSKANRTKPSGDVSGTLAARAQPPIAYRTSGNSGSYETGDRVDALTTGTDRTAHLLAYQCHGSNVGPMGTLRVGNGNETGGVPFVAEQGSNVRRLTPTECERLMGFPDGWTEGHSDTARYRMLGNAVVPSVAEWIGKRIGALDTQAGRP